MVEPGHLLADRYRLERRIGEGGMGEVWAARHHITNKMVAVKLLKGVAPGSIGHQRFLQEARAASDIGHPAVVAVHDAFVDDDTPVLVMDLLEGETLGDRLKREQRLTLADTIAVLTPVIEAVAAAHARSIVHRDLKPDNIFLTRDGAPRVLDFGLVKLVGERAPEAAMRTRAGAVLGTPGYMAPEQALGDPRADHRVDVWALGVILYRCVSGVRPIEGDTIGELLMRLVTDAITPLEVLEPDLPPAFSELVGRMLSREPAARPDLREVLEAFRAIAAPPAPTVVVAPTPMPVPRARRGWLIAAVAVGLAACTALTIVLIKKKPAQDKPSAPRGTADRRGVADGRPLGALPGGKGGILLWLAPNGWQLRTTSRRPRHFTGTVEIVRGDLLKVDGVMLEPDDSFEHKDKVVTVSFHSARDFDGVSIVADGGACLRVNIEAEGVAPADHVFVGRDAAQPDKVPFTICAGASSFE